MIGKAFASLLVIIVLIFFTATLGGGCANPIAPSGGPRDSLPPVLLNATPVDSTRSFAQKRIVFSFNEFVELDNWRENVIISPVAKHDPTIESKLRTVTIKINDTLEENTTYTYDFGNAIKDINEGNIAKNFSYVFSTGKTLDTLRLSGTVINAQTGRPDSTVIAMLHRNADDSAVIKEKPRFVARVDNKGHFVFRNLPKGVFYLYALKNEGNQLKYASKSQLFAFANRPVTIGSSNPPDTLYDYLEKEEERKPATTGAARPPVSKSDKEKEKEKEKDKRLKFSINLENGQQDLLGKLEFIFADALKTFDSTKASLTDEAFKPVSGYSFARDTSNKKLVLSYKWPENTAFNLIVDRDFAEDSAGRKIPRTDTLRFRTKKEADYGNLTIRFNNLDLNKKPVLELMQGDDIKYAVKLTGRDFRDKLFRPGEYDIRILYDDNGNGIWDAGEFFGKHRQPEKVTAVPKKLSVKANWDNENTVEL